MDSQRTLVQASPRGEPPAEDAPTRRIVSAPAGGHGGLVLGRYELLERLGSGGFGVVWRAHDEMLGRDVALKRIWLGPDGDRERATREAHASARLSHPAIVALYEACVLEDAFYLISELIEGETLARLIAEDALEDEEVLEIGLALTGALVHAHARGVIHRDIKPHNVLVPHHVQKGGEAAKLTDFGGASLVGEDALTRTGDILGTLAYMAPEQSEGGSVGEEADLYALALVLYEALAGFNPVRGATPAATARRIGRELAPLQRARRDLPRSLTSALDGALAPAPEDRGSLEHLQESLEESLERGLGRGSRRRASRPAPEHPPGPRAALRNIASTGIHPSLEPATLPEQGAAPRLQPLPVVLDERPQRLSLPRAVWIALAVALVGWQAWIGHPGLSLLIVAALLPLIVLPPEPRSSRVASGWLACALAPILGLAGLAGAFPAIAGQAARWRERAVYGALGYWWLLLAEPLLGQRLWLGAPAGTPARPVWEGSIGSTATHLIAADLTLGALLGALLWAAAATLLPWLVRGRNATLDVLAAVAWSTALALASPLLDGGLIAHLSHPTPRGLLLGAIMGGMLAVAARALRGPV